MDVRNVIIVGSGPAGLTAALYCARADLKPLVLAGVKWGGQLMLTTEVENYPGFVEGILGPDLMKNFREQAERFGAEIINEDVTAVDFKKRPFEVFIGSPPPQGSGEVYIRSAENLSIHAKDESRRIHTSPAELIKLRKNSSFQAGEVYRAKSIIISTGAETNWLGLPNEQRLIGRGISSCAPCDAFFFRDRKVIVVGGGDSAMEEALFLTKFASEVTIVHRRDEFRASKIMADRAKANSKISFLLNSVVVDVFGEEKVTGVKIKNVKDSKESEMVIDGIFVAIGHSPMTAIFKGQVDLDEKGYVVRKLGSHPRGVPGSDQAHPGGEQKPGSFQMMTSAEGVFVAGDAHDYHYKQAVTAAGYGSQAALEVEKWLETQG